MDQFFSDLRLISESALDATAHLWVPAAEVFTTMPAWAYVALIASTAFLVLAALWGRRQLRGDRIERRPPTMPAAGRPGDAGQAAFASPAPPDAPEVQGLAEILAARGLDPSGRQGRLRTFAGELDDLRDRLDQIGPAAPASAQLFHDAKDAIAGGDLSRGTDLLVRAAQEEGNAAGSLSVSADTHGRAAALARLVAGDLMQARGDLDEAETLYRLAADAAPQSIPELRVECLARLGALAHLQENFGLARGCFADALQTLEAASQGDHPDIGGVLNNLGLACDLTGDQDEAERYYQRALAADEKHHGDDHLNVASVLNNLGLLYRRQGKTHAAEPLFRRAVAIKEKALAPNDQSLLLGLVNHAATLRDLGRDADARTLEARAGVSHDTGAEDDADALAEESSDPWEPAAG
ncbi:MAG: tetratricopeptide repeat protein [Rhodospirillaceae bacterium]